MTTQIPMNLQIKIQIRLQRSIKQNTLTQEISRINMKTRTRTITRQTYRFLSKNTTTPINTSLRWHIIHINKSCCFCKIKIVTKTRALNTLTMSIKINKTIQHTRLPLQRNLFWKLFHKSTTTTIIRISLIQSNINITTTKTTILNLTTTQRQRSQLD